MPIQRTSFTDPDISVSRLDVLISMGTVFFIGFIAGVLAQSVGWLL